MDVSTYLFDLVERCSINILYTQTFCERYGGGNSTTAEEVSRFQCLFPNPNWLVWKGIPPPKTCSNFPGIDSCLMVTKRDFLKMEASLGLNERSQNVAKGGLST